MTSRYGQLPNRSDYKSSPAPTERHHAPELQDELYQDEQAHDTYLIVLTGYTPPYETAQSSFIPHQQEDDIEKSTKRVKTRNYHPDFTNGDLTLISRSELRYKVEFFQLQQASTFFASFQLDLTADPEPWFDLADVDSSALTLLLATIQGRLKEIYLLAEETIPCVPEAIKVASKYEFTRFPRELQKAFAGTSPIIVFTIAALLNNEVTAKKMSTSTLKMDLTTLTLPIGSVLENHAPAYYERLKLLHQCREETFKTLETALATDLAGVNIHLDGFGHKCKKRFGRGCEAYIMTEGRFPELEKLVSAATVRRLKETGATDITPMVEDAIYQTTGCQTCAHRFINAYGAVLSRARLWELPRSI